MLKNSLMDELRAEITQEDKTLIDESFALADRIHFLLEKHNISQRQLAEKLGKSESEVSKWLSGGHNFTTHTLTKIGIAIGERVYLIPDHIDEKINQHLENVLRSYIFRDFTHAHEKLADNLIYENFDRPRFSELEVNSAGIIVNKKRYNKHSDIFKGAYLNPESFRNIENVIN